jgi:N-acetylglucosamine-6-phosphate deacetylase
VGLLIKNATIISPMRVIHKGWIHCQERSIVGMGGGLAPQFDDVEVIDASGLTALPGFIDLHVHGAVGFEAMDANPDGLRAMATYYAAHGVTGFLPTTWTDSHQRILAALEVIAELNGPQPDGATILGAHLEGPYLNPAKCGAQNLTHIRRVDRDEARAYLDLGVLRLLALAPEFPENHWLIDESMRRGVTVSVAHSAADYLQIRRAVERGLTHATHTFNGMNGLHHREPGTAGAVIASPEISCELIADNVHVHPAIMTILLAAKGVDKVVLVSDAIRGAGMPDGEYQIDERAITVRASSVTLPDGTLAGSTLTLDLALQNLMAATGQSLAEIWQTSSLNAARAIGWAHRKGSLEVSKDADIALVDDNVTVQMTIAEGRRVYQAAMEKV